MALFSSVQHWTFFSMASRLHSCICTTLGLVKGMLVWLTVGPFVDHGSYRDRALIKAFVGGNQSILVCIYWTHSYHLGICLVFRRHYTHNFYSRLYLRYAGPSFRLVVILSCIEDEADNTITRRRFLPHYWKLDLRYRCVFCLSLSSPALIIRTTDPGLTVSYKPVLGKF